MKERRPATPKRGYTIREAAFYTGLSESTIQEHIADGSITHKRAGLGLDFDPDYFSKKTRKSGRIIILREELDAYLDRLPQYGKTGSNGMNKEN